MSRVNDETGGLAHCCSLCARLSHAKCLSRPRLARVITVSFVTISFSNDLVSVCKRKDLVKRQRSNAHASIELAEGQEHEICCRVHVQADDVLQCACSGAGKLNRTL